MRNKGKTTFHTLSMKRLIDDIMSFKFTLQPPEHYLNSERTDKQTIPGTYAEKLERQLVEFFVSYLNTNISPATIAERYGVSQEEVITIRDTWHVALVKYYV